MARYGICGQQYFDNNGDPLSGGLIYVYEPSTLTQKDTYTTSAESVANPWPYVLDAAGRQEDIFFTGEAKIILKDADGTQIDVTDPIGTPAASAQFDVWDTTSTYALNDIVQGSNGLYYKSIVGSNAGNDPISTSGYWAKILFIDVYDTARSYLDGDLAIYSDALYVSLQSSNVGNTPGSTPTYWRPLSGDVVTNTTVQTVGFNAAAGNRYLCDTATTGAFTMVLPASPVAGDIVGFVDYAGNFATANLTIDGGTEEIMNDAADLTCDVNYFSGELQYSGATRGWLLI